MGSIEVTASEELGGGKRFSGVFLAGGGWGVYFCARFFLLLEICIYECVVK